MPEGWCWMDLTDLNNVINYKADGISDKVYTVKEGEDFRGTPQSVKLNSRIYRVILLERLARGHWRLARTTFGN